MIADRLEQILLDAARARKTLTYRDVAEQLELQPPQTIHQVTLLLEGLTRKHAASGDNILACVVVSRTTAIPAIGFFMLLRELGVYEGGEDAVDMAAFHAIALRNCFDAGSG